MNIQTSRYALPLLATGQAQKEFTHNEALLLIDNLMHIVVEGVANDPIDATPTLLSDTDNHNDQAWLIGDTPIGDWEQKSNQIAIWTSGGWRYVIPNDSMQLFNLEIGARMVFRNGVWEYGYTVMFPLEGDVIDSQARESIQSIINILQLFGLSKE